VDQFHGDGWISLGAMRTRRGIVPEKYPAGVPKLRRGIVCRLAACTGFQSWNCSRVRVVGRNRTKAEGLKFLGGEG
jgi:hypothetical protein